MLTSGAHRVARLLGVGRGKIRRTDPTFVLTLTGQEVGGVAPVGHPRPVRTLVDAALEEHPHIWAGAGSCTPTLPGIPRRHHPAPGPIVDTPAVGGPTGTWTDPLSCQWRVVAPTFSAFVTLGL
ncbi:YbaK/EbsC family protein [Streptomyces sasae]|uniref:YbaK/EbsC family protein n=1 Tax=Streptomyces sasae TaxID=1266772 RepID=UPI00292E3241|nr:YbaK/EbsC family protein [Streptomyces sasae]